MVNDKYYVYSLIDPRTDRIRYVGQTNNPLRRYNEHVKSTEFTSKGKWVQELRDLGLKPRIVLLDEVDSQKDVNIQEYRWMYIGRQRNWDLTNEAGMKTEYTGLHETLARLIVEFDMPGGIERLLLNLLTSIIGSIFAFRWAFGEMGSWFIPTAFSGLVFCFIFLLYSLATKTSLRNPRSQASLIFAGIFILVDVLLIWTF